MARILSIETSTEVCSVCISEDGICKDLLINKPEDNSIVNNGNHSKILAIYIDEILKKNNLTAKDFDAVALSSGPGSYTGLRIGSSTAKGFCFGANIPLIEINTLQTIAGMAKTVSPEDYDLYIPMIEAKRMEVYTAIFDKGLNQNGIVEAKIIDENSFSELDGKKVLICGNGSDKCVEILSLLNFEQIPNLYPSAEYMCKIAEEKFNNKEIADLVYFEPFYLKEFVTTTPKNKLANLLKQQQK